MLAKFYIMIMVLIIYVLCLLKLIERTLKISAFYADCTSKKLILLKKKKTKTQVNLVFGTPDRSWGHWPSLSFHMHGITALCKKLELIFWAVLCPAALCGLFSCSKRGLLSSCGAQASHRGGFSCEARALRDRLTGSTVMAHGLSCSSACGIFPIRGQTGVL